METADRLDTDPESRSGTRRVAHRSARRFARIRTLHDSYPTTVWLVQELDGRRDRVALKTFRSAAGVDVEPLLLAERDALMSIKHRNVVRCFGIARDAAGAPHLVLEALDGLTLQALRESFQSRGTRPSLGPVLALGVGFAAALEAVHSAVDPQGEPLGLSHGRVDSSNLFVTRAGRPVLIGFSCARGRRSTHPLPARSSRHLAPEDRGGGPSSQAADVFSLASVLVELVGDAARPTNARDAALVTEILSTLGACLDGAPDQRPTASVLADRLAALMARSRAGSRSAPRGNRLRTGSAGASEDAPTHDATQLSTANRGPGTATSVPRETASGSADLFATGDLFVPIDSLQSCSASSTLVTEDEGGPLESEPTRVERIRLLDAPSAEEPPPSEETPTRLSAESVPPAVLRTAGVLPTALAAPAVCVAVVSAPSASQPARLGAPSVSAATTSASSRGAFETAWASARSGFASDPDDEPTQRDMGAYLINPPSTETSVRLSPWPRWLELLLLVTVFVTAMWVLVPR